MLQATVVDYQHRFRQGPVGRWSATMGTLSAMPGEVWEFHPDGTGRVVNHSPAAGQTEDSFSWLSIADWTIQLTVPGGRVLTIVYDFVVHDNPLIVAMTSRGRWGFAWSSVAWCRSVR